jgi:predicted enzyme related to lactoylglutathione lyase
MSDPTMPDPLDALRIAADGVAPATEFAVRLRARIERALALPQGVTVSDLGLSDPSLSDATVSGVAPSEVAPSEVTASGVTSSQGTASQGTASDLSVSEGTELEVPALVPYLAVVGARAAIDYYREVFGARVDGEPYVMPDDRIGHAELALPGGARLMLSDAHPEIGVTAPVRGAGHAVTLHLTVQDVDAVLDRGVQRGGLLERPAADYEYGRNGTLIDPFGHRWMIAGAVAEAPVRPGDFAYVSLQVPDEGRAALFFATVLGWRVGPADGGSRSLQVTGQSLHHGIRGGATRPGLFFCLAVDDLHAAHEGVLIAGGTAGEPTVETYGRVMMCADDQGTAFALHESSAGGKPSPAGATTRQGDLAYVTFEMVDSARARRFYGEVMGWQFVAGQMADGWQIQGPSPMAGMSGGHAVATTVPMYKVDDVVAAVAAVRAAGGTATEPEQLPYGLSSTCADDQGARFYLGQLY